MILVRTFNGGSLSFRTQRGTIQAKLKDGFMYVEVDPIIGRQMQVIHRFHKPPAAFSLEMPKKEEPVIVKEEVAEKKPAAPKKKVTKKRKKKVWIKNLGGK